MRSGTFGVLFITPNTKPHSWPWVSLNIRSAPSLYLSFTRAQNDTKRLICLLKKCKHAGDINGRAVLCFRPQRCGCSFSRVWEQVFVWLDWLTFTHTHTHKHTLALCPSCVACNLVILGLWPVKGQLWNKITVCSVVRVSPEWCHGGTDTSANSDATHLLVNKSVTLFSLKGCQCRVALMCFYHRKKVVRG